MQLRVDLARVLAVVAVLAPAQAHGQGAPAERQSPTPGTGTSTGAGPTFTTQLFAPSRTNLLGDLFGLHTVAAEFGLSFGLTETSEVLGNVTGGVRQGADYDGLTTMSLALDTQKAFGWSGGTFNVSALQIHGRNLATDNTDSLQTPSVIEAKRATRLWEIWFQQTVLGGMADLKIGQQSLDEEFIVSVYAGLFIDSVMGWPVVPSYDQYAGGPAYPLSSLGVRLRIRPTGALTVLGGVFDDNPPGGPFNADSQVRGAAQSGTAFSLGTGALFFCEMQVAINQPASGDAASHSGGGVPGTYKLGAWFDTGSFPDQNRERPLRDNFSLYAIADQTVWQSRTQPARSAGIFARIMGAPDDRNLVSYGLNAGVVLKDPLPGRDNDSAGIGFGLAKVSRNAILLDGPQEALSSAHVPVRSSESFLEATYQLQVAPWWQLQPDVQYVFLPGGGIADPNTPSRRIGNEAIVGIRTNVTF